MPVKAITKLKAIGIALYQRALPTALLVLAFYMLFLIGQSMYYKAMPGDWFVHYYNVSVTSVEAGQDVPFSVCRTLRYSFIPASLTRTLYKAYDTTNAQGQTVQEFRIAGQYTLPDYNINQNKECTSPFIYVRNFQHTPGFWRFHTDVTIKINGEQKTSSYDSPTYEIKPRPSTQELELQLQQKIDELQRQLDELKAAGGVTAAPADDPLAPTASATPPGVTQHVATSAPPEDESVPSASSSLGISRLLDSANNVLNRTTIEALGNLGR